MARMRLSFVIVAVSAIPSDADLGAMCPIFATSEDHHMHSVHSRILHTRRHSCLARAISSTSIRGIDGRAAASDSSFRSLQGRPPAVGSRLPNTCQQLTGLTTSLGLVRLQGPESSIQVHE